MLGPSTENVTAIDHRVMGMPVSTQTANERIAHTDVGMLPLADFFL